MKSEVKVKKESAPKKAKGGKRTGRPVKNGSERQKRLAAKAARVAAGEVIKRGRPSLSPEALAERVAAKNQKKAVKAAVKAAKTKEKVKPNLADLGIAIAPTFIGTEA